MEARQNDPETETRPASAWDGREAHDWFVVVSTTAQIHQVADSHRDTAVVDIPRVENVPAYLLHTSLELMQTINDPYSITPRQRQVIQLIATGMSNEELGRSLGISPRTAKAHCDALRQKLGVKRRPQIPYAYRRLTGADPLADCLDAE